jgi:hypothetical protein
MILDFLQEKPSLFGGDASFDSISKWPLHEGHHAMFSSLHTIGLMSYDYWGLYKNPGAFEIFTIQKFWSLFQHGDHMKAGHQVCTLIA